MNLRLIESTPPENAPMPLTDAVNARVGVLKADDLAKGYGDVPVFEENVIKDAIGAYKVALYRSEWEERFLRVEFPGCAVSFYFTKDGLFRGRIVYEGEGHLEWQNKTLESAAEMAGGIVFSEFMEYVEPSDGGQG